MKRERWREGEKETQIGNERRRDRERSTIIERERERQREAESVREEEKQKKRARKREILFLNFKESKLPANQQFHHNSHLIAYSY